MPESTGAHPAFNSPPAADGKSTVPITAEEFAEFQRLKDLEPQFRDLQGRHQADLATLTARDGELAKALAELDTARQGFAGERATLESKIAEATGKVDAIKARLMERAKAEAISAGLAGVAFVGDESTRPKVAGAFRDFVGGRFEAREDDQGNVAVFESATGKPAAEALKAMLTAPEFSGFFAANTRGGAGTDGTGSTDRTITASGNPHRPGTLEWHAANLARSRENASGLVIVNQA